MAKYIDVDQIMFRIRYVSSDGLNNDVRKIAFSDEIAKMPAADVAEVRHGEWVMRSNGYMYRPQCSVCGGAAVSAWAGTLYCPHCGAKMDRKEV